MADFTWSVVFPEKKKTTFNRKKPRATIFLSSDTHGDEKLFVPINVAKKVVALDRESQLDSVSRSEFLQKLTLIQKDLVRVRIEALLQRRDYSTFELSEKLRLDGFFIPVVEKSVARAVEVGLLNDQRYADLYVRSKVSQGWGPLKIACELKQRGIELTLLDGWPDTYLPLENQREHAHMLAQRKRLTGKNDYEKIVRFLAAKGYPLGICTDVAKQMLRDV